MTPTSSDFIFQASANKIGSSEEIIKSVQSIWIADSVSISPEEEDEEDEEEDEEEGGEEGEEMELEAYLSKRESIESLTRCSSSLFCLL